RISRSSIERAGIVSRAPLAAAGFYYSGDVRSLGFCQLAADRLQRRELAFLVLAHQPRIAGDIGRRRYTTMKGSGASTSSRVPATNGDAVPARRGRRPRRPIDQKAL